MEFSIDQPLGKYQITAYEPGIITVNEQHCQSSLIISNDRLITDWPCNSANSLEREHLSTILTMTPEVLIVGTGEEQVFLDQALFAEFYNQQIGVEVMTTAAACRTFNALSAEGRQIVAALIIDKGNNQ